MRALVVKRGLAEPAFALKSSLGMRFLRRKSDNSKRTLAKSHLERLVEAARETFHHDGEATPAEIERVSNLLEAIPAQEVGLEEYAAGASAEPQAEESKSLFRRLGFGSSPRQPDTITYLHICENESFALGIFCLPQGSALPLHDHPQMTVFSRVMYGKLQVDSYDWVQRRAEVIGLGESAAAKPVISRQLTADESPVVLFPAAGGNIHSLKAVTSCAVLDLLAPPYDLDSPDRGCSYYAVDSDAAEEGTVMLKRVPSPNPYNITNRPYLGIPVE